MVGGHRLHTTRKSNGLIGMQNLAALRESVFPLFMKNLMGGGYRPPSLRGLKADLFVNKSAVSRVARRPFTSLGKRRNIPLLTVSTLAVGSRKTWRDRVRPMGTARENMLRICGELIRPEKTLCMKFKSFRASRLLILKTSKCCSSTL